MTDNPFTVSPAAQAAIDRLDKMDPVLAPLDLDTLTSLLSDITQGIDIKED